LQVAILDNQIVYADDALYKYGRNKSYICPCCGEKVILKAGDVKIPYFSHLTNSDCVDDYDNEMSEWHRYCQSLFPKEYREVIITKTWAELYPNDPDYIGDMTKETHIADICYKNFVVEFQHSPMSSEEFFNRTSFYLHAGYNLVWIFDWNSKYWNKYLDDYYQDGNTTKWIVKYAPKTCIDYNPKEYIHNLMICFSYNEDTTEPYGKDIGKSIVERIVWARPDKYDPEMLVDYSRIVTNYLGSIDNLAKRILST